MSTLTMESKAREFLLAENLDAENVLQLRHLVRQFNSERKAVKDAVADAGKMPQPNMRLAVANWALDSLDEARKYAAKDAGNAICALIRGIMDEEEENLESALQHYRKAAELAPSSAPCVLSQLSVMRKSGQVEDAMKLIEKLRKEFSDKADLLYHEARCHEDLGEPQEALECYQKALEFNPQHANILYHLARLCDRRGLDREAKEYYQRIGPGKESTYINACLNLALLYEDEGDLDNALSCCQRVLRVDPNNTRAKLFLDDAEASTSMYYSPEETKQSEQLEAVLRTPVSDFELSVRSRNCLTNMNIQNLGDLVKRSESEMLAYKNFGETSLREIKEILNSRGLRLGMMREDAATRAALERARRSANQEVLNKPIDELELTVRSRKCMDNLNIKTIGELVSRSEAELANAKNFGRVSLNEIKKRLAEIGLSLKEMN